MLENPIYALKFLLFRGLTPKFRGTSFRPQKGISLRGTTRLSPHWCRSDAQCDRLASQNQKIKLSL